MNAPLYNAEILRLAASIPHHERLTHAAATAEKRSPVCGSRVTVDVGVDEQGRVDAVGLLVRACALGQASASLLAAHILGRTPEDEGTAPDWPGIDVLAPARDYSARHASIRLAFEAAAEAAEQAVKARAHA
jgi:NifU-like protein involved in Fe-S cluster formation